jgi:ABC-2 type transport system ATP-binding protein
LKTKIKETARMSDYAIETQGLTRYFGRNAAVNHLDLKISKGSIYGFLGRNGAGKSTAIKMLMGLLEPTAGTCSILGCDSGRLSPGLKSRIGYITEGHRIDPWMTIKGLEKFQMAFYPDRWDSKLFGEMLEYFELPAGRKIKHLSNGQRAQVSLALTLAPDPEVLIMDDPTLGLDVLIRRQFLEGMIQLIQRKGRTIIFSSHILSDVERVADRIAVLDNGVLRADCSLDQFRSHVRKLRFYYSGPIPAEVSIPGLLYSKNDGSIVETVLIGTTDEQIEQFKCETKADSFTELALSLEDQFIEFTQPQKRRRLFSWEVN